MDGNSIELPSLRLDAFDRRSTVYLYLNTYIQTSFRYSNLILLLYCDLTHHFKHRMRCVSLTVLCCPATAKSSSLVPCNTQRNTHLEYICRTLLALCAFKDSEFKIHHYLKIKACIFRTL